jgi:hypothetical protein
MAKVLGFTIEIQGTKVAVDTTNQLREAMKKLQTEMGNVSDKELFDKMSKEASKLKAELKSVTDQQRNFVREIEAGKTGTGSYQQLNAELVKLNQNYKKLSETERNGKIGQETLKNIQGLQIQLKSIDASMGNFQRNVGNYQNAFTNAIGQIVPGVGNILESFKNVSTSASVAGGFITTAFAGAAVISAVRGLSLVFTEAAQQQEQMQVSFDTLTGSLVKGSKIMEEIKTLAANTPFEIPQLQEGA